MNELGTNSRRYHREIGMEAARAGLDMVVTVGKKAKDIAEGASRAAHGGRPAVHKFEDNAAATEFLSSEKKTGDVYLIKGSRSMKTEEIISGLIGNNDNDN
jgi:UDP-N-acetylmuramoyl-tripeptide--D-alanyl-D-alanine ligase